MRAPAGRTPPAFSVRAQRSPGGATVVTRAASAFTNVRHSRRPWRAVSDDCSGRDAAASPASARGDPLCSRKVTGELNPGGPALRGTRARRRRGVPGEADLRRASPRRGSLQAREQQPRWRGRHCRCRTPAATCSRRLVRLLFRGRGCRCLLDARSRELTSTAALDESSLRSDCSFRAKQESAGERGAGLAPRPRGFLTGSEFESGADVHHRCASGVDRADDLLGVDPLEVHAGRRDIRVLDMRVIWQVGQGSRHPPRCLRSSAEAGYAVGAKRRSA